MAPCIMTILLSFVFFNVLFITTCFKFNFHGINYSALDNYTTTNFTRTIQVGGIVHCWAACVADQSCQAVFVHPVNKVCMLLDMKYQSTSGLQSCSGMKYYSSLPTSCSDVPYMEFDGNKSIQIDADGRASEFEPATVWCDLSTEPGVAVTVLRIKRYRMYGRTHGGLSVSTKGQCHSAGGAIYIRKYLSHTPGPVSPNVLRKINHHDYEAKTLVDEYEDCLSYDITLTYHLGIELVKKVIDVSNNCKQYLLWECLDSKMFEDDEPCAQWRNRNMKKSHYFIGSGSSDKYCECGPQSTCPHETGCNCSYNEPRWEYDEGFVTNKDDLPITGFSAGDTGILRSDGIDEMAYHTIGPVLCW